MDNNNIKFISNPAGFLQYNIVTVVGAADVKHQAVFNRINVARLDLVRGSKRTAAGGASIDVTFYSPRVLPVPTTGDRFKALFGTVPTPVGLEDATLRAYWLPWAGDTKVERTLDLPDVAFFFTAGFSGCSFSVSGDARRPVVMHSNFTDSLRMPTTSIKEDSAGVRVLVVKPSASGAGTLPDVYDTRLDENMRKAVGDNLAGARRAAGLERPDFEKRTGIPMVTIENLENGLFTDNAPFRKNLAKYAIAVGVPPEELLTVTAAQKQKFKRLLTRDEKYTRAYMLQQLKSTVKSKESRALAGGVGDFERNDIFGIMSFDGHYGAAQSSALGLSAQASVVGYRTMAGRWRFVSQYHEVTASQNPTIRMISSQCVICHAKPMECICP